MSENILYKEFKSTLGAQSQNKKLHQTLNKSLENYHQKYLNGINQFENISSFKEKLQIIRSKSILQMEKYLLQFEGNFKKNGGELFWADDANDVFNLIQHIIGDNIKSVVKSKSMATEEIDFNAFLENQNIKVTETDLGEYIVQLRGEKPSHITAPALHLSKDDITLLFHEKFESSPDASAEEITAFVRKLLRREFTEAELGVSGANFLVADSGSICITENEGNASLTTAWPNIHIVLAGIEKIIPSFTDLGYLWPVLSSHATGQKISVYNHMISGPRQEEEGDGPEKMYVILLNNGRDNLLINKELRQSLHCIKCGACSNICPVYKIISGHSYNSVYNGPIGSVTTPHLRTDANFFHLSFASSLCGKCTEICPVNIPIDDLLLYNRSLAVEKEKMPKSEIRAIKLLSRILKSRKRMNMGSSSIRSLAFKIVFRKKWGVLRAYPDFPKTNFNKSRKK
ncbi:MAG: lactate utilization protein [Bacteroidales bacterium]|nr:lactate utilization protein [Bacteroidales bacterium]